MKEDRGDSLSQVFSEARTEPKNEVRGIKDKLVRLSIIDHFKDLSVQEKIQKRNERRLKNKKSSSSIIMLK